MISYKNAWHFLTESKWFWSCYLKMNFNNKKVFISIESFFLFNYRHVRIIMKLNSTVCARGRETITSTLWLQLVSSWRLLKSDSRWSTWCWIKHTLFRTYTLMVTISNVWLTCQRIKCVEWEITCKMHNLLFRIVILVWGQTNKFASCTWFRNIGKLKNLKTKCLKCFLSDILLHIDKQFNKR